VDTLPLVDSVATTESFTDRYIYTLGPACGGTAAGGEWGDSSQDVVYAFTPSFDGFYSITADAEGAYDLGLMVTTSCPSRGIDDFDAMGCLGSADAGREGAAEIVEAAMEAGRTYFILVDGYNNDTAHFGGFALTIALGEDCSDDLDNDRNGDTDCADAQCNDDAACDEANVALYGANSCSNNGDDDGDGFTDCTDEDCARATNCIESNCDNSLDDNNNGATDCDDPGCQGTAACGTLGDTCQRPQPLVVDTTVNFNTCTFTNTARAASSGGGGCSSWSTSNSAPDIWYRFVAPATQKFRVTMTEASGWDAIVNVVSGAAGCPANPIAACLAGRDEPVGGPIEFNGVAGETYYIIADGWSGACGNGTMRIVGVAPEVCDDNSDNDADGAIDCADRDCFGVGACPSAPPGDSCATPVVVNTTTFSQSFASCSYTNSFQASAANNCRTMGSAGDVVVSFTAPEDGTYRIVYDTGAAGEGGTGSFDAILNVVKQATCPTVPIASCLVGVDNGDPETATITAVAGETFWIIADGWSSGCGNATLNINKLAPEVCDDTVDNDGDARVDCNDSDCLGVGTCRTAAPGETCQTAIEITGTTFSQAFTTTCDFVSTFQASGGNNCRTMGSAGDAIVKLVAPQTGRYRFSFDTGAAGSGGTGSFDSILNVVKSTTCPTTPIAACVAGADGGDPENVAFDAVAGETFWVIADGFSTGCGAGTLSMTKLPDEICNNGTDDDSDGLIDCADGPSCGESTFCNESLTANGCGDGINNDNDGLVDCADPDCGSDATACPNGLLGDTCGAPIIVTSGANTVIDTCNYNDRYTATNASAQCQPNSSTTNTRDVVFAFTPTVSGPHAFRVITTSNNVIAHRVAAINCTTATDRITLSSCLGSANAVSTSGTERVDFEATAGVTEYFMVDSFTTSCGAATIVATAILPEVCNNTTDDDLDGNVDCADTDCGSTTFCNESVTENGCTDGVNNDNDGLVDCADPDCVSNTTACPNGLIGDTCAAPLVIETAGTTTLNLCTYANNVHTTSSGGCEGNSSTTSASRDAVVSFVPPFTGNWRVSAATTNADIMLHRVTAANCGTGLIAACQNSADNVVSSGTETFTFTASAGVAETFVVDAYSTACGNVVLNFEYLAVENCDDGIDNNSNNLIDCDDPACIGRDRPDPLTDCPAAPTLACEYDVYIGALPYNDVSRDLCDYSSAWTLESASTCENDIDSTLGGIVYAYTATQNETVRAVVTPRGTWFDPDWGDELIDIVVNVTNGCNADGESAATCVDSSDTFAANGVETVDATLTTGQTMYIHVNLYDYGGFGNDCGGVDVSVTRTSP
jgi:hypothetical protein